MIDNAKPPRRFRYRFLLIAGAGFLVAVAIAFAIRHNSKPVATPANTSKEVDPEELDRLRSLGYLDFVPVNKDDRREGVVRKTEGSYAGYNFFTNAFLCMAVLTDSEAKVVNYWQQMEQCDRWAYSELLENGDLLVVGREERRSEKQERDDLRFLMKLSWEGTVLWKRALPVHHDVEVTPSGQLLTLTTDFRMLPQVHPSLPIRDNRLSILSESGEPREHLSLYDVLSSAPQRVTIQPVRPKNAKEIDLIHANSIEWIRPDRLSRKRAGALYSPGNILFCTRHQDIVGIVDWAAKKLLWSWGQGILSGPHDATMLSNGNILIFDNGLKRGWSRVIELDPDNNTIVWSYQAKRQKDFFTAARGSNQRLPNGNTLIAESDKGRAVEVTPKGEIVWEYLNPFKNAQNERATIVRFYRFDTGQIESILRTRGKGRTNPPLQVKTGRASREAY